MITRSRSRVAHNKQTDTINNTTMITEKEIVEKSSSELECEINNQLGEPNIFDENTANDNTEAWGPQTETTPVIKEEDIYTILQQLIKTITQQKEDITKRIEQQTQSITQQAQDIADTNFNKITTQKTQQINEFRKENQELIEQIKKETREIVKEEINTVRNERNSRLDSIEEVVKENE